MTKSIFRPTRIKDGKRIRTRMYRLAYQLPGMPGKKYVSLKTSDKQVAERKADDFLRQLQQEEAGIVPTRATREAAEKPLSEHLDKYLLDLQTLGRDPAYVYHIEKRISKLLDACGWRLLKDITAESFLAWRAKHQELAAKTLNEYLNAITAFLKWMDRCGLPSTDVLHRITKVETRGREKVKRRAFTLDELQRLVAIAGVRRIGYLAPFYTALRRAELEQLEWGDIHLDAEQPFIETRASTTKNHERSEIPLHPVLAAELRAIKPANASSGEPVFKREMIAGMDQMRADLQKAEIAYLDAQGRRADFHALRGSCNTHMALEKIDPDTRKKLMRHSDLRLTLDKYTDTQMLPLAAAVRSLPGLGQYATPCATNLDISGHSVSQRGTKEICDGDAQASEGEGIIHDLAQPDAEGHELAKSAVF